MANPACSRPLGWLAVVAVAVLTGGLPILLGGTSTRIFLAVAVAVPLGVLAAGLAVTRFTAFLTAAILVRVVLDVGKAGPLEPATLLAVVFCLAALARLLRLARLGLFTRPSRLTRSVQVFAGLAMLSGLLSHHQGIALESAARVVAGALMFAVVEQELRRRPRLVEPLLRAFFFSALVPLGVAAVQLVGGTGNHDTVGFNRVLGTSVHPTSFATYLLVVLGVAVPLAVVGIWRRTLMVLSAASILMLYATFTRSAWLAFGIGMLYVAWRLRKRLVVPMVVVGLGIVLFVPSVSARFHDLAGGQAVSATASVNSLSWRAAYWREVLPLAKSNPVTGIGLDTTGIGQPQDLAPHNALVQAYVEMGVAGLIALALLVRAWIGTVRQRRDDAVTPLERGLAVAMGTVGVMILVESMASNVLTQTLIYWYAAAGCAVGYASGVREARTTRPAVLARRKWPRQVEG